MFIDKIRATWKSALLEPQKLFAKEIRNANLEEATKMVLFAGIISGIGGNIFLSSAGFVGLVVSIITMSIMLLIIWLVTSGIYYGMARLLGGKGTFVQQSYLYALFTVPINILWSIAVLIPFINYFAVILLIIYEFYLLTVALRVSHRFSTRFAILSWLIPIVIIIESFFFFILSSFFPW